MGWWGHHSDAHDGTAIVRTEGMTPEAAASAYEAELQDLASRIDNANPKEYTPASENFLGTVRQALVRDRVRVAQHYLERAKSYATDLLGNPKHTGAFRNPALRTECLRDDIEVIEDAVANDGMTQKGQPSEGLMAKIEKMIPSSEIEPNKVGKRKVASKKKKLR